MAGLSEWPPLHNRYLRGSARLFSPLKSIRSSSTAPQIDLSLLGFGHKHNESLPRAQAHMPATTRVTVHQMFDNRIFERLETSVDHEARCEPASIPDPLAPSDGRRCPPYGRADSVTSDGTSFQAVEEMIQHWRQRASDDPLGKAICPASQQDRTENPH